MYTTKKKVSSQMVLVKSAMKYVPKRYDRRIKRVTDRNYWGKEVLTYLFNKTKKYAKPWHIQAKIQWPSDL